MRITFVLPGRSMRKPIGGFKVVYEYANGLVKRGHQVNVIHPLLFYPEEANLRQKLGMFGQWVASSVLGIPKLSWFDISPKVGMLIVGSLEEENIPKGDVIIATAWQTAEWVNRYGQDKGEKFYLIQGYENWSGPEERVKATWKMPLKKIVISHWLEEIALKMGENTITHIPNGLDFKHFHITQSIEKRDPMRIGMLYSPTDWKGSKDGIEALKIVKEKIPELKAVFFSVHPRGIEIPKWMEFHKNPAQDELAKIYNSCAIFIHASWSEGWALPPAEAMACGCALVTTDSKGLRDYAIHRKTALVSKIKDPHALAQNILELIKDNNLRIYLAKEGNKFIQRFTWDKAVEKMEACLLGRLDKPPLS